jgi:hypothetical protein
MKKARVKSKDAAKVIRSTPSPVQKTHAADLTEQQAASQARQLILNSTPAITRALVREACEGSYLHARLLFDFTGLSATATAEPESQIAPIVKLLAEELGLELPAIPASA